jgi:hypothetical protein
MGKRTIYYSFGFALGALTEVLAMLVIRRPHHWEYVVSGAMSLGSVFGVCVTYIAERKGKVKSIEELHRPLTLFPRTPDSPVAPAPQ